MKNYFRLVILLIICLPSCEKYLDEKPDQALVVPGTLKDLQALLDNNGRLNKSNPSLGMASDDDYFLPVSLYNARSENQRRAYVWNLRDYSTYPNDWAYIYNQVYVANVALEGIAAIEKNSKEENDWNNIKGSALVYRAQSFLRAIALYAKAYDKTTAKEDLGIVLRLSSDFNEQSVRSNLYDSYFKVLTDLKEAASLLPVQAFHVMRPSQPAAYSLLARAYLNMAEFDSAWKYADLSLSINNQLLNYNDFNVNANLSFQRFNKEVIFHSTVGTFIFSNASPNNGRIDTVLYNSYAVNDLRRQLFFRLRTAPNEYGFKGSYNGDNDLFVGVANDENYLIRAECYARIGDKDAAMNDLNTLLVKRWKTNSFIPFTAATAAEALSIVLTERRKELVFRDLRWMDIKRLNKEGGNIIPQRLIAGQTYSLPPNDNRYALQLPADIVQMAGLPQNP